MRKVQYKSLQGLRVPTLGIKANPAPPDAGESYFASCERDDGGHCLPAGQQGGSTGEAGASGTAGRIASSVPDIINLMADERGKKRPWTAEMPRAGFVRNWKKILKGAAPDPEAAEKIASAVREAHAQFDLPETPVVIRKLIDRDDKWEGAHWDGDFVVMLDNLAKEQTARRPLTSQKLIEVPMAYENDIVGTYVHELGHRYQDEHPESMRRAHAVLGDAEGKQRASRLVSKYAATRADELVAECYAMWKHPEFSQLSEEARELVEDVLRPRNK